MIGGVSTLGEELGWRGFLQGSLRPLGRVRGYLLVALMWEAWHFTSHLKGTLTEGVSRMSIYPFARRHATRVDRYRCRQWRNLPDVGCAGVHSALALAHLKVARSSQCPHAHIDK